MNAGDDYFATSSFQLISLWGMMRLWIASKTMHCPAVSLSEDPCCFLRLQTRSCAPHLQA